MMRLGILGITGRMGKLVSSVAETEYSERIQITEKVSSKDNLSLLLNCDAVIDFSSAQAVIDLAKLAIKKETNLPIFVIGSTGWRKGDQELLNTLAQSTRVLAASNFSAGILTLCQILKRYAPVLDKFGYDPVILDTHHQHKKDAPSGTAITLQKSIRPQHPEQIQTVSIRAGEVVGEHEITFYGPGDQITLKHFAQDRSIFARGAIEVALWMTKKKSKTGITKGRIEIEDYFNSLLTEEL